MGLCRCQLWRDAWGRSDLLLFTAEADERSPEAPGRSLLFKGLLITNPKDHLNVTLWVQDPIKGGARNHVFQDPYVVFWGPTHGHLKQSLDAGSSSAWRRASLGTAWLSCLNPTPGTQGCLK